MEQHFSFDLRFATAGPHQLRVVFSGAGDEPAIPQIVAALSSLGRREDAVTGFALSPADALDSEGVVNDSQFLLLDGEETLRDLRFLIGPDDDAVILRSGE